MIKLEYFKEDLLKHMKTLKIDKKGTLLVHSSYKSIGDVEGGAETVLDALMEYMQDGLLLLPTHTWEDVVGDGAKFEVENSPSCVGILPELFRKRKGVVRSLYPTHSLAAIGQGAMDFLKDDHLFDTPCNRGSSYGKLLDAGAQIMLLGVDHRTNTFIHGVEEWVNIPGRITDSHEQLFTILPDGSELPIPSRRHYGDHWSLYFPKVDVVLEEEGAVHKGEFGDAETRICDSEILTRVLFGMLSLNPLLFSDDEPLQLELYKTLLKSN